MRLKTSEEAPRGVSDELHAQLRIVRSRPLHQTSNSAIAMEKHADLREVVGSVD